MSGAEKELNNKIYKKEVIQGDEKSNSETNTQYRTSSFDSPYESVSEISNDFNFHFFNELNNIKTFSEEKNIYFEKDKAKKCISPEMDYFLCNEEYMKEKMPEGNNYKIKSRNFIKKSQFKTEKSKKDSNCSLIKIEDVDLNKVNEILKDIKYVENININYKDNFINTDLNSVINEKLNLNELQNISIEKFDSVDMSLYSYINNYNFNFKRALNYNINGAYDKQEEERQIKEEKSDDTSANEDNKPKKKLMTRPGDWYCKYCFNLNFSFRNTCNRCRLSKCYSYEKYIEFN